MAKLHIAKLHNVLALAATALAFTISTPHSAQAQRPDSRGLQSDPFGRAIQSYHERVQKKGGIALSNWQRAMGIPPGQRTVEAEASRNARLRAYQRELDELHTRVWFEQQGVAVAQSEKERRAQLQQAREERTNAQNMTLAQQGNPKVRFKCFGPNQDAMLWQSAPTAEDAQRAVMGCNGNDNGQATSAASSSSGSSSSSPSDIRLKRDIDLVDRLDNGLGLYRYRYLWSDQLYVGVMAQEVATVMPAAVVTGADGYLRVDYGRLGLRLQTWDEWRAAH